MSRNEEDIDDTEMWRQVHRAGQEKRASNRESSATLLTAKGVSFETRNNGSHLMLSHGGRHVDFWPGTGKWVDRDDRTIKGRGVFRLLRYVGVEA